MGRNVLESVLAWNFDHPWCYAHQMRIMASRKVNSREVINRLEQAGWFEVSQAGSHKQFKHDTKRGRVTVPHPKKDIPAGTLRSIEKQAGIKLRK